MSDGARIADDFASTGFDGFLVLGITVKVINCVFETWASDIMEKTRESLDFVMSEVPDN